MPTVEEHVQQVMAFLDALTVTDLLAVLGAAAADAGVPADSAESAARTVVYFVLGSTVDEQSRLQWDAAGADVSAPVWAENSDARFAFGLRLLVDGIAAHTRADV